jgi:60 kDa SS-A/Ro ribonucleoprotein
MRNSRMTATTETATNYHGAPTFQRPLPERVLQVLTTNTLGNTFYASAQEITAQTLEVLQKAAVDIPEFLAKALVYARNKALLKTVPVIGLVALSTAKDKSLFRSAFNRVVLIPDDLRTFVEWCASGKIKGRKGFGGCVVEPVREWLCRMTEYHALKYGSTQSKGFTLRDIIRMSHPKAGDAAVHERLGWLARGWDSIGPDPSPTNPSVWALELLKRTTDEAAAIRLITEFGLPFEVVVPSVKATTPETWEALMRQAPYFNLLRSINTYARHGLFEKPENIEYVVRRLTDKKSVEKSRLLPLRFHAAFMAYTREVGYSRAIADAMAAGLDLTFANMPSFPKGTQVCIAPDVSGSMSSEAPTRPNRSGERPKYVPQFIDIAGIFSAALLKKCGSDALLLPVDTRLHHPRFATGDSMMSIAREIANHGGGGTSLGLPVQHLLDRKIKIGVYIGITDNEDWAFGNGYGCRDSFGSLWQQYRQKVSPEARAFLVTIAPYGHAVAPSEETSVSFIYGWSEQVVSYIPLMAETGASQVDAVNGMTL